MTRLTIAVCCTALALAVAAGCEEQAKRPAGASPAAELASARFQATVYETRVPETGVGAFDARSLAAKAATAEDLQKALEGCGKTKVLYQVDQTVNLADDRIHIGKREPFVTNTRVTDRGQAINTIQYEDVGVIFQIAGKPTAGGLDATVRIEMSALTDSGKPVSEKVSAVTVRSVQLGHHGPVELGRPVVLVSVDASSKDDQGNAVAYVCRLVFGEPGS